MRVQTFLELFAVVQARITHTKRNYATLAGQKLEFQRELRLLQQAAGVGVQDSGLVESAMWAMRKFGLDATPMEIVRGVTGIPRVATRSRRPE